MNLVLASFISNGMVFLAWVSYPGEVNLTPVSLNLKHGALKLKLTFVNRTHPWHSSLARKPSWCDRVRTTKRLACNDTARTLLT